MSDAEKRRSRPDYGVDAPAVMRNLFLFGGLCLLLAIVLPRQMHLGPVILMSSTFYWPAGFLLAEALLFLLYVKVGKFRHRDFMLAFHRWRGDEQVLDVGCGRGLLLIGAAKRLSGGGHATGIDIWSTTDMGGNSVSSTRRNIELEGVIDRCTLLSEAAQHMSFTDGSFDVIVSNLCLHNIYDGPTRHEAVEQIARVLKPGGVALISDYKRTGEYASIFRSRGFVVEIRRGSWITTFPPLVVVIARKPAL